MKLLLLAVVAGVVIAHATADDCTITNGTCVPA